MKKVFACIKLFLNINDHTKNAKKYAKRKDIPNQNKLIFIKIG